jgi:sulfite exporter TauE/SafE
MESEGAPLAAALLLGLVGSLHCLGMCGGIAGALSQSLPPGPTGVNVLRSGLYSCGRITSYAAAGLGVGAAGQAFADASGLGVGLRIAAGLLLIGIALHVGGWWNALALIERAGLGVWRRLVPLVKRLGRPDRAWKIYAVGLLWGWLPCGLVYSSLATASTAGSARGGLLFMLCFGIGTLPALLLTSGLTVSLRALVQQRRTRTGAALLLFAFGLWTLHGASTAMHSGAGMHGHAHPHASSGVSAEEENCEAPQ